MSKLNDPNFGSRDYDPSGPAEVSKLNDPNFGSNRDNFSQEERAAAENARNAERKQERETATSALKSGSADAKLSEIAKQGGTVGRRLEREIKRFEQTGRVSGWLAGETLKAESAQNAAQQSAFREQVLDVISNPLTTIQVGQTDSYIPKLSLKPIVDPEPLPNCIGLALYRDMGNVWIGAGTVAGQLPSGFDPEDGKFIANGGSGYVFAEVNINGTTGQITSISINNGASIPEDTDTKFHYFLGYYEYNSNFPAVTNYGCGSVSVTVCRNWFTAEPPYWGVTFNR